MIRIYPTTASGLSHTTYTLNLPNGEGLNLGKPRPESVATTLSGAGIVTAWAHSIEGHQTSTSLQLTNSEYATLRTITEHATVFEWVIAFYQRTFTATLSVTSATPSEQQGKDWAVVLRITIVSELHRS